MGAVGGSATKIHWLAVPRRPPPPVFVVGVDHVLSMQDVVCNHHPSRLPAMDPAVTNTTSMSTCPPSGNRELSLLPDASTSPCSVCNVRGRSSKCSPCAINSACLSTRPSSCHEERLVVESSTAGVMILVVERGATPDGVECVRHRTSPSWSCISSGGRHTLRDNVRGRLCRGAGDNTCLASSVPNGDHV